MITHGHHCSHTANGEWSLYIAIIHAPHGENMRWSCMLIMGDHGRSQPYKLTVQYHHIQWLSYLFSPYIPTISVHHTTKTNILDAYVYMTRICLWIRSGAHCSRAPMLGPAVLCGFKPPQHPVSVPIWIGDTLLWDPPLGSLSTKCQECVIPHTQNTHTHTHTRTH